MHALYYNLFELPKEICGGKPTITEAYMATARTCLLYIAVKSPVI